MFLLIVYEGIVIFVVFLCVIFIGNGDRYGKFAEYESKVFCCGIYFRQKWSLILVYQCFWVLCKLDGGVVYEFVQRYQGWGECTQRFEIRYRFFNRRLSEVLILKRFFGFLSVFMNGFYRLILFSFGIVKSKKQEVSGLYFIMFIFNINIICDFVFICNLCLYIFQKKIQVVVGKLLFI